MTKVRITLRGDNDDDTDDGDGSDDVDGNEDGDGDGDKKYPNCSQDWHPEGNLVTSVATFTPHSEDQFGTISCSAETAVIGISKMMMILYFCHPSSKYLCDDDLLYFCHPRSKYLCGDDILDFCHPSSTYLCDDDILYFCNPSPKYLCVLTKFVHRLASKGFHVDSSPSRF